MSSLAPRAVLVTRQTELQALLARHGTRGQVEFFLAARGQTLDTVLARDIAQTRAIAAAKAAIPAEWSFAHVWRDDLDRFLFAEGDIVIALGQDGLVPNLAKYVEGQPVIGLAPSQDVGEGLLIRHRLDHLSRLLPCVAAGDIDLSARPMVEVDVGGDRLLALNELFIGHQSHQSARYDLQFGDQQEFQSSSGLIVATGTGMTGWAQSIMAATQQTYEIAPEDQAGVFFVREPWPSRTTGCDLRSGQFTGLGPSITSRIETGGVVFADGIEQDFLPFDWGAVADIRVSDRALQLVL